MNIHHLELFYYVAKHGGISEAVRNIPYGIQQPAVSYQVIQLEEDLGVTLFRRRPFSLTPAGEKLFQFVQPFFGQLDSLADELRGGVAQQIRFGASEVVLKDHLPEILRGVKARFPRLKLTLRDGYQPKLMEWVINQEVDLIVSLLEKKLPTGLNSLPLMELPLVLWVEKSRKITSSEDFFKQDKIVDPLIALPSEEIIPRQFQQTLTQMGVDWFPTIEVSTLALVETYVAQGYGVGIGVDLPKTQRNPSVRSVPLVGFPNIIVGAIWQGKANPLLQSFVDEIQRHVQSLKPSK